MSAYPVALCSAVPATNIEPQSNGRCVRMKDSKFETEPERGRCVCRRELCGSAPAVVTFDLACTRPGLEPTDRAGSGKSVFIFDEPGTRWVPPLRRRCPTSCVSPSGLSLTQHFNPGYAGGKGCGATVRLPQPPDTGERARAVLRDGAAVNPVPRTWSGDRHCQCRCRRCRGSSAQ